MVCSSSSQWKGWEAVVAPPPEVVAHRHFHNGGQHRSASLIPRFHRVESATSCPSLPTMLRACRKSNILPNAEKTGSKGGVLCAGFPSVESTFRELLLAALSPTPSHPSPQHSLPAQEVVNAAARNRTANFVVLMEGCHPSLTHIAHVEFGLAVQYCPLLPWRSMFSKRDDAETTAAVKSRCASLHLDVDALYRLMNGESKPLLVFLAGHVLLDAGIPWACLEPVQPTTPAASSAQLSGDALSLLPAVPRGFGSLTSHGVPIVLEHHISAAACARPVTLDGVISLLSCLGATDRACLLVAPVLRAVHSSSETNSTAMMMAAVISNQQAQRTAAPVSCAIREIAAFLRRLCAFLCVGDPLSVGLLYTMVSLVMSFTRPMTLAAAKYHFFRALRQHSLSHLTTHHHGDGRVSLSGVDTRILASMMMNVQPPWGSGARSQRENNRANASVQEDQPTSSGISPPLLVAEHARWFKTVWHMIALFPPYMEVLSASDPAAPLLATFLSHGVVVLVRNVPMVMRTLLRAGFEAVALGVPTAPADQSHEKQSTRSSLPSVKRPPSSSEVVDARTLVCTHGVRIACTPRMSEACWKRLLILLWSLPASDVGSPLFRRWTRAEFTKRCALDVVDDAPKQRNETSLVPSKQNDKKSLKDKRRSDALWRETLPHLYQHPNVANLIEIREKKKIAQQGSSDATTADLFAGSPVGCTEPPSALAITLCGPFLGLGLAKL